MSATSYIKETRGELKHVNWPSRKQTISYTALVIGLSLIVAAYLGLLDYIFSQLIRMLLSL